MLVLVSGFLSVLAGSVDDSGVYRVQGLGEDELVQYSLATCMLSAGPCALGKPVPSAVS